MPEFLDLRINVPDEFDRAVHGDDLMRSVASGEVLSIFTKDNATEGGGGGAVICFEIEVDGKRVRAQYSTTIKLLKAALKMVDLGYDDGGKPIPGTFGR